MQKSLSWCWSGGSLLRTPVCRSLLQKRSLHKMQRLLKLISTSTYFPRWGGTLVIAAALLHLLLTYVDTQTKNRPRQMDQLSVNWETRRDNASAHTEYLWSQTLQPAQNIPASDASQRQSRGTKRRRKKHEVCWQHTAIFHTYWAGKHGLVQLSPGVCELLPSTKSVKQKMQRQGETLTIKSIWNIQAQCGTQLRNQSCHWPMKQSRNIFLKSVQGSYKYLTEAPYLTLASGCQWAEQGVLKTSCISIWRDNKRKVEK